MQGSVIMVLFAHFVYYCHTYIFLMSMKFSHHLYTCTCTCTYTVHCKTLRHWFVFHFLTPSPPSFPPSLSSFRSPINPFTPYSLTQVEDVEDDAEVVKDHTPWGPSHLPDPLASSDWPQELRGQGGGEVESSTLTRPAVILTRTSPELGKEVKEVKNEAQVRLTHCTTLYRCLTLTMP